MKISLYLGLLGATLVPASVWAPALWAQPVLTPQTFIVDAAQVLTPDFVREADVILVGRLAPDKQSQGIVRPARTDYDLIRGDKFVVGRGLVVPSGEKIENNSPLALVFARIDPVGQQPILLARIAATPSNIERAKKLASENQKVTVTFSTDKTSYAPDDEIIAKWEARNTSPTVQKIYVGQYALQYTAIYGGSGRGTGSGGSHTRKAEDYVTLAPGEIWSDTRTIRGPFPQGQVFIEMTLDSSDNFLGSESKSHRALDRAAQERVEGVALFKAQDTVAVEIVAPSPAAQKALAARLNSANWSEALAAATTLSQLQNASEFPEMRALATHPWNALRMTAATALARDATTFSPQLRALAFDHDMKVRSQTFEALVKNRVPATGLAALAVMAVEAEAVAKGALTEKRPTRYTSMVLTNLRDSNRNLGDLLAARIGAGQSNADGINAPSFLNGLAENGRNLRLTNDKTATPEEEKAILQAWKEASAANPTEVKSRTAADLQNEVAAARAAMFDNFKVGPQFPAIVQNLQKLNGEAFPKPADESRQFFENLAPDARPDILHALQWGAGETSRNLETLPALKAIAQIEGPQKAEANNFLIGLVYSGLNRNAREGIYVEDNVAYAAAVALGYGDAQFARPHLQIALQSDNPKIALGAAIGLFIGGQKSALPAVFEPKRWDEIGWLSSEDLEIALAKATGLTFKNRSEWKKWWDETGSKAE